MAKIKAYIHPKSFILRRCRVVSCSKVLGENNKSGVCTTCYDKIRRGKMKAPAGVKIKFKILNKKEVKNVRKEKESKK